MAISRNEYSNLRETERLRILAFLIRSKFIFHRPFHVLDSCSRRPGRVSHMQNR